MSLIELCKSNWKVDKFECCAVKSCLDHFNEGVVCDNKLFKSIQNFQWFELTLIEIQLSHVKVLWLHEWDFLHWIMFLCENMCFLTTQTTLELDDSLKDIDINFIHTIHSNRKYSPSHHFFVYFWSHYINQLMYTIQHRFL